MLELTRFKVKANEFVGLGGGCHQNVNWRMPWGKVIMFDDLALGYAAQH